MCRYDCLICVDMTVLYVSLGCFIQSTSSVTPEVTEFGTCKTVISGIHIRQSYPESGTYDCLIYVDMTV